MSRTWSPYQQTIFAFVAEANAGNAIVNAVAGSGKSTTIVEACNHIPSGQTHLMLAFNKSIAEELKERGVNARTFHSLTYTPVTRAKGTSSVDSNKLRTICKMKMPSKDEFLYANFCCRLVGIVRQMGIGFLCPDERWVYEDVIDHHMLELDSENAELDVAIDYAQKLLTWSNASPVVDFDDLLYLAVKDNIALPKYDFIFVDEAQDTNAIQREILRKIMKPTSRIIAVGDPAQAIYGFRGADSNSLKRIEDQFGATNLPLTVSYRCGTEIVKYAQQWVQHIEPAPGAPAGVVNDLNKDWNTGMFQSDDLIVCRTTKPLVALAYRLLRDRIPAKIMGRDIGAGLISLIKRQKATSIDQLIERVSNWAAREADAALLQGKESKAQAQQDKADAIIVLCETLPEHERTVEHLVEVINNLFTDRASNCLTLATIHKAKGMEADRVWWLNRRQCPAKWAKKDWMQEQERNLCYVATTRAKSELNLIEER
jgi:superfamily I DNA/RNA helicase